MTRTTRLWFGKLKVFKDEKGLTLVETLVTVAIVGVAVTVFALALSTGSMAVRASDQEVTAQSLARTQMEYIKGCIYDPDAITYPTVNAPDNYSISVAVVPVPDTNDNNIQKVTANVSRDGQVLLTVEDYKVKR